MGLSKDIVVVTPDEFERRKNIVGTLAYPAHHEGRILWEALGSARQVRDFVRAHLPPAALSETSLFRD